MEIFKPAPTDLPGLKQLLERGVDTQDPALGIFGAVDYEDSKIKIYDQNMTSTEICEVTKDNGYIIFTPFYDLALKYKDANAGSYNYRFRVPENTGAFPFTAMLCKYGFVFYGAYPDWRITTNIAGLSALIIARTATDVSETKRASTAFISAPYSTNGTISNIYQQQVYITQHAYTGGARDLYENTSPNSTSVYGFYRIAHDTSNDPAIGYVGPGYNLDKTILDPIPIPGKYGSNEFFETAFFRKMDTFEDNGLHIINGKKYGVLGNWALLDE